MEYLKIIEILSWKLKRENNSNQNIQEKRKHGEVLREK